MAEIIVDAKPGEWLSINSETGIAVGTEMTVINVERRTGRILESATEPTTQIGYKLTNAHYPNNTGYISAGSEEVWIKGCTVSVEAS